MKESRSPSLAQSQPTQPLGPRVQSLLAMQALERGTRGRVVGFIWAVVIGVGGGWGGLAGDEGRGHTVVWFEENFLL